MPRDQVTCLPFQVARVKPFRSRVSGAERMGTTRTGATRAQTYHTIHPTTVYTLPEATAALTAKTHTLVREIRMRRLRASKRGGRYYLLGEWLIEWLRAGEVKKPARDTEPTNPAEVVAG
jgi:hypothetical protein